MWKGAKSLIWAGLLMSPVGLALELMPGRSVNREEPQRQPAVQERAEKGRRVYRVYCAACHGESGRGDGPVARDLKVAPADLTSLAARNEGRFPQDRAYQAIDGRLAMRGHGTRQMPIWGLTFQTLGSDADQEREVRERIFDLLAYLESIQRKREGS